MALPLGYIVLFNKELYLVPYSKVRGLLKNPRGSEGHREDRKVKIMTLDKKRTKLGEDALITKKSVPNVRKKK